MHWRVVGCGAGGGGGGATWARCSLAESVVVFFFGWERGGTIGGVGGVGRG